MAESGGGIGGMLWGRRSRKGKIFVVIGALILAFGLIGALGDSGEKSSDAGPTTTAATTEEAPATTEDAAATTESTGPPGDNMNYRTRQFVKQLRGCQAGIAILASSLQSGSTDLVELSSQTSSVKGICSDVRQRMATMDTDHFDDQALTVEIGINEYKDGLDDVRDYLDTQTPSKAVSARDHFQQGHAYAAEGFAGINERRAVYNLPPLKE